MPHGNIMNRNDNEPRRNLVDRAGELGRPRRNDEPLSKKPFWWWILFMPGTIILWFDYMFPNKISGVFGSARRRNVPLFQIVYSLFFYAMLILIGIVVFA